MLIEIVNKILIVMLFLSILTTLRHAYYFVQAFLTSTEEQPIKYRLSTTSLFYLGVSLAYILSVIFTGIKI
jgi:hypothetical protein